jgi:hypothetical protein
METGFPYVPINGMSDEICAGEENLTNNSLHRPKHFFSPVRLYQCSQAKVLGMGKRKNPAVAAAGRATRNLSGR